jgi:hypothetical protein
MAHLKALLHFGGAHARHLAIDGGVFALPDE